MRRRICRVVSYSRTRQHTLTSYPDVLNTYPPLSPSELLEVSMIASVAGEIEGGALTGGGMRAKPGEPGVRSAGTGFAAPAAGERRGRSLPRQSSRHLSGALHAGRRDESLPLRPRL